MRTKKIQPSVENTAAQIQNSNPPQKRRKKKLLEVSRLISSGSTLMNLMCSDTVGGAFPIGSTCNLIGDSSSGKTLIALTALAEAARNKDFAEFDLYYDGVEPSMDFDLEYLFGHRFVKRLKIKSSRMVIGWQRTMNELMGAENPFIYVLDSLDALDTMADKEKAEAELNAYEKGTETRGSFAMAKAKKMSEVLRRICGPMEEANGFLMIISQTRDKIGFGFERQTRAGGRALKFYAAHEIWLSCGAPIKARNREIGTNSKARCKKNKLTGKHRTTNFSMLYDYGLDDISSCIEFLIAEEVFVKPKNSVIIECKDFNWAGSKRALVKWIEDSNIENELKALVQHTWNEIENSLRLGRKQRF